jgi:hypothetical protein
MDTTGITELQYICQPVRLVFFHDKFILLRTIKNILFIIFIPINT